MGFLRAKINMKIRHASSLMVVPAKKAGVKCSWFFCLAHSIPTTNKKVRADININVVQKFGASKPLFPVY